jgi:hypothetical protein
MYDIIFISYQEPNADNNFAKLKARFPRAQRVHGVKGIHQAHIAAAKKSFTKLFWVVDGDAEVVDTFNFDYVADAWSQECVHVWRSINPVNGLQYGYGGIKLLPKHLTQNMDLSKPDMTTSISSLFKAMPEVSNITAFNTDPFNTWKSAFRECCKLASRTIDRQDDTETQQRLDAWCTLNESVPYGFHSYLGAQNGKYYGENNQDNPSGLKLINDFDWLESEFNRIKDQLSGR